MTARTSAILEDARDKLERLITDKAIKTGTFTLSSGERSNYYIDGKQVTLDSEGLHLLALCLMDMLADEDVVHAIGGMSIGADPITGGLLVLAASRGKDLRGFLVRKEAKSHGTKRRVEGPLRKDDKVVVIDDVVTSGKSVLDAIRALEAEKKVEVVKVLAMFDRLQGARENFDQAGYTFEALFSADQFSQTRDHDRDIVQLAK